MIALKIEGMSCEHCVKAVREALVGVPGVDKVDDVSLERGEAVVAGTPQTEALLAAVRQQGYEARLA
ncbi:MAG: cation transporter [Alphaproteobacteria bacterium]|jgi:copper chaperone|nr:cation transporter [Alphaproteobacteria bacterium]